MAPLENTKCKNFIYNFLESFKQSSNNLRFAFPLIFTRVVEMKRKVQPKQMLPPPLSNPSNKKSRFILGEIKTFSQSSALTLKAMFLYIS